MTEVPSRSRRGSALPEVGQTLVVGRIAITGTETGAHAAVFFVLADTFGGFTSQGAITRIFMVNILGSYVETRICTIQSA